MSPHAYGANPVTCPVRVLQVWLEQAGISDGPLFRSMDRHRHAQAGRLAGIDVARVVKKLALRAGLDPVKYAGHSLRAGHATSAAIAGASERSIMNQTGHRSVQMVRRYIRDGSLFRENSAGSWVSKGSAADVKVETETERNRVAGGGGRTQRQLQRLISHALCCHALCLTSPAG